MMGDKELADKVVMLHVLSKHNDDKYSFSPWSPAPKGTEFLTAKEVGRDWRVAGALMEKFGNNHDKLMKTLIHACAMMVSIPPRGPLPRAITEACVAALAPKEQDGKTE